MADIDLKLSALEQKLGTLRTSPLRGADHASLRREIMDLRAQQDRIIEKIHSTRPDEKDFKRLVEAVSTVVKRDLGMLDAAAARPGPRPEFAAAGAPAARPAAVTIPARGFAEVQGEATDTKRAYNTPRGPLTVEYHRGFAGIRKYWEVKLNGQKLLDSPVPGPLTQLPQMDAAGVLELAEVVAKAMEEITAACLKAGIPLNEAEGVQKNGIQAAALLLAGEVLGKGSRNRHRKPSGGEWWMMGAVPAMKQAGGSPKKQAGGSPKKQAGGSPKKQAGGSPKKQAGGSPKKRAGGSPMKSQMARRTPDRRESPRREAARHRSPGRGLMPVGGY